ncbi:hypothetical protein MO867_08895 [Microbulbifer sp. OS29]|uniref:Uncharacterized protein n=1 Tax=Microbulbifer okhotskensis TaxID=2926617 RepID=A0A9X2J7G4_9GAMM|nr:hypothetical protein [Microbulbifer okhotskensis]MCO1334456.1 hypothetical protein [Microbulbifer okhotskensis]
MQRREPTLGGSAALEPSLEMRTSEEIAEAPEPQVIVEERRSGFSFLGLCALILAIGGLGASGFLYQQWQEGRTLLSNAEARIDDAEGRIAELEKRFSLSDEESTASVEVLNAKAKENSAEIRKLWGVAYDTNRKNIASNKTAVTANKKQVAALKTKLNGLDASVKKIAAVESALTELRKGNTDSQREMSDKLARLERQLASVRSDLTMRVGANEEAVESIDAYRRSVNKDLVQLRDAIRSLQTSNSTASSM